MSNSKGKQRARALTPNSDDNLSDNDIDEHSREQHPHLQHKHHPEEEREKKWKAALLRLQKELEAYQSAKTEGDSERMAEAEDRIPDLMRAAGDAHPDPAVREKMHRDADEWADASEEEREGMTHPLLKGILQCLEAPFMLAAALFYGVGKVLEGMGKGITSTSESLWDRWSK